MRDTRLLPLLFDELLKLVIKRMVHSIRNVGWQ